MPRHKPANAHAPAATPASSHERCTSPPCLQTNPAAVADTIRILVSSDNHVGYAERDPVRGDDSYTTFNEIMEIARDRDVPFLTPRFWRSSC